MSGYIGVQPVPQATQRREYFTATSGQTTFNTNGYTPGYIDVFMNGVKLSPSDFTATNGSDVVLASGATTGDLLQVISFTPFNVANQTFIGNVNLSSGAYQIGGNNVIDSSRIGSLASLSVGTTNTSAQLVVGDDTDSTATLLQLRNDDSTYSQSWTFSSDTSKDLVITGASGSGGIKLSPGSRGVDVNSGPLKVGGTTVIDSSRNITAPNVTISSSNSNEFTFTRSASSKTTLGFGTANQSIASTGPLSIKPDGTTVNKYTFESNQFTITPDVSIGGGTNQTWAQLAIRKSNDAAGIALESGATNGRTYEIQSGPNGNFLFYDRTNSRYLYSATNTQHDWYESGTVKLSFNQYGLNATAGAIWASSASDTNLSTYGAYLGTYTGGSPVPQRNGELTLVSAGKTGWNNGDELGRIRWHTGDGSGIGQRSIAMIEVESGSGNGSNTTTMSGEMVFYTSAYNTNQVERMRITDDGFIGINEASPSTQLHIKNTGPEVRIEGTGGDSTVRIHRADSAGAVDYGRFSVSNSAAVVSDTVTRGVGSGRAEIQTYLHDGAALNKRHTRLYAGGSHEIAQLEHIRWLTASSAFSNPTIDLVTATGTGVSYSQCCFEVTMYGNGVSANEHQVFRGGGTFNFDETVSPETAQNLTTYTNYHVGNALPAVPSFALSGNTLRMTCNRQTNYDFYRVELRVWGRGISTSYSGYR